MKDNLDKEEKELQESYEAGDWNSIPNVKEKIKLFRKVASNTLKKDARINIRISNRDLLEIKRKAVHEGIPYQTLVSSILHKFLNGNLVEKTN